MIISLSTLDFGKLVPSTVSEERPMSAIEIRECMQTHAQEVYELNDGLD
jgi:hypothetical protein